MMGPVEFLDQLINRIQTYSDHSRSLVSITAATGLVFISWLGFKILYHAIQGLRLYLFAQICCRTDYANKYGKWALVTGATDGIGLEMAKELAKRGQSIIIVGRNEEKLASAKEQVSNVAGDNNVEVLTVKIDMSNSDPANYQQIRRSIDPDNRDIGLLINNAGVMPSPPKNFHEFEQDVFLTVVNVNVVGLLCFTKMILPGMIKRGRGLVVNVSSALGQLPAPYVNVYGPSKSFVDSFSKNLKFEYRNFPIDIINLTPGSVQTNLFRSFVNNKTLHKASLMTPSSSYYAKSAINALSTRISEFSGCLAHAITNPFGQFALFFGFYHQSMLISLKVASNFKPSSYKRQGEVEGNAAGDEAAVELNPSASS